jgi:hypothetical protein
MSVAKITSTRKKAEGMEINHFFKKKRPIGLSNKRILDSRCNKTGQNLQAHYVFIWT